MDNKEVTKYIALSGSNTAYEFSVKNNYEFSLKRQNMRIDLVEEADGFLILLYKGIRYPVEIVSRRQNEYEILLNGVAYTFSVETPFSLKRKRLLAGRQGEVFDMTIKSPMPGKILDVSIEVGQEINKGDTLVVLEAMKMENEIAAPKDGTVVQIATSKGAVVETGTPLIVLA